MNATLEAMLRLHSEFWMYQYIYNCNPESKFLFEIVEDYTNRTGTSLYENACNTQCYALRNLAHRSEPFVI